MKKHILETIYKEFENWSSALSFCCRIGCSTCCTQNVTIIALEGERILEYCIQENLRSWLFGKLDEAKSPGNPQQTTNEYVLATIQDKEEHQAITPPKGVCPFLEKGKCAIYPVRPFSCRCFNSETLCRDNEAATVAEHYFYGSTVAMQLIEHLGQFERWGYMTDVLASLIHSKSYEAFLNSDSINLKDSAKNIRTAQPIPGLYIPPEHEQQIKPLLRAIFDTRIGEKTVEQILNGQ